jgi:hypothetical protein
MPLLPGDIITAELLTRDVYTTHTGSQSTISTTETVEETFTLTIPADWTEYDVDIQVFGRVVETSASTGNTNITWRVRTGTTTGGTEIGVLTGTVQQDVPDNILPMSFGASLTGETSTGTRSFVFTAQAAANSLLFSYSNLKIFARARRTD